MAKTSNMPAINPMTLNINAEDEPLQVIAAVLGHSDTRITHKHYAHLMPSYIADIIKQNLPDFGKTEETNVKPMKKIAVAR
jgi:hypothetical protein